MKYQTYPAYKDSGVEWLGEVPEHWEIKRLKFLCKIQTGDKDTVNAIEDGKYPFFVRSQTVEHINSFTFDCEAVLTAGDGVGVGKVFHYVNGKFDFHQRVYMMNNFSRVTGIFFFHYLATLFHKVALDGGAKSTVDSLRMPLFMNFQISVPLLLEQQKIAQFLDHETAKIDTLIEKQQRLIELLKEKRQAVISHAVTKGLNPNAPMKDSGVAWLGEVPEGWKVIQFKRLASIQNGRDYKHIETDNEDGYPVIGSGGEFAKATEYTFSGESVLLGRKGTIDKPLYINGAFWVVDTMFYTIVNTELAVVKYLYYCALTIKFDLYSTNTALPSMTQNDLGGIFFSIPEIAEQQNIVAFLDLKIAKFNELNSQAQQAIELLKERRTALISAAVTGKIDVREWGD